MKTSNQPTARRPTGDAAMKGTSRALVRVLAFCAAVSFARAEPVEIKLATILPTGTSAEQRLLELRDTWRRSAPDAVKLTVLAGSPDSESLLVKKMRGGQIQAAHAASFLRRSAA